MIVSLPWYEYPGWEGALDRLWQELCAELQLSFSESLPENLERHLSLQNQWSSPDLLLSQCCGPDLIQQQAGNLMPIARPVFAELDCPPGYYYSHIVATSDLAAAPILGVNSETSFSGCLALLEWCRSQGLEFSAIHITGSHEVTLNELRRGRVQLAAIDANSWQLLDTSKVSIIDRSREQPSPPFVCGRSHWHRAKLLREALATVLARLPTVGMEAVVAANLQDYRPMSSLEDLEDLIDQATSNSVTG